MTILGISLIWLCIWWLALGFLTLGIGIFLRWPEAHKTWGIVVCLLLWFIPLIALFGATILKVLHTGAVFIFDPDHGPLAALLHFVQSIWKLPAKPPSGGAPQ